MTDFYTDEEIELLRAQLRNGHKLAREEVIKRGYKLHPRIAKLRGCPYYPGCQPENCTKCWEHDTSIST